MTWQMLKTQSNVAAVYSTATVLAFAAAMGLLLTYTPTEATMGPVQKIFYLHLPVAINTFVSCLLVFVASIGYLASQKTWWDDLAAAAAKTAVQLCAVVLLTGMIWGRGAWGQWWTWSPRLTFSLALFLLYVVYLVVRSSIESPPASRYRRGVRDHRLPRCAAGLAFSPHDAGHPSGFDPAGAGDEADAGRVVRAGDDAVAGADGRAFSLIRRSSDATHVKQSPVPSSNSAASRFQIAGGVL